MPPALPSYVQPLFVGTAMLFMGSLYYALSLVQRPSAKRVAIVALLALTAWSVLQLLLSSAGFYSGISEHPERLPLMVAPMIVTIVLLFSLPKSRAFIREIPLFESTLPHILRVPVEIAIHGFYLGGIAPEIMTYNGQNFDIVSGITAPIVAWWGVKMGNMDRIYLIIWHFLCLALLGNIVVTAILSTPTPFQQFGLEQPNVAIFMSPFVLLPSLIVPIVLFLHLAALLRLFSEKGA
ncbi:MAG: hypothetical protein EAZ89_02395 [Bacteroidetes bacterium]|nr:MAG: hypothetical protein EAZ89_02395 [Bacteroidota bacterium]